MALPMSLTTLAISNRSGPLASRKMESCCIGSIIEYMGLFACAGPAVPGGTRESTFINAFEGIIRHQLIGTSR